MKRTRGLHRGQTDPLVMTSCRLGDSLWRSEGSPACRRLAGYIGTVLPIMVKARDWGPHLVLESGIAVVVSCDCCLALQIAGQAALCLVLPCVGVAGPAVLPGWPM